MSERVTLTDEDRKLIVEALWHLHANSIVNPEAYPKYALASKQRIQQIENKLFPLKTLKPIVVKGEA